MLLSGPREIIVAQHGHPLGLAAQSGSHLPDILLLFFVDFLRLPSALTPGDPFKKHVCGLLGGSVV